MLLLSSRMWPAGQHFSSSFISLFEYFFLLLSALEIRTEELSRHFSSQNISVKQHCPLPRVKKEFRLDSNDYGFI